MGLIAFLSCRLNSLPKFLQEFIKAVTHGKFIVGFVAFSLHMFIQIASITSRHISVAFKIPPDTTGIYFTKLFSARGIISLSASILSYIIKMAVNTGDISLTLIFSSVIFLSRFIILICVHTSKNPALSFYISFLLEGIAVGLFQMTFYSWTGEYSSVLSICFKCSRMFIFLLQLFMDSLLYKNPIVMVRIHFWLGFITTLISTFLWFAFCINRQNERDKEKNENEEKKEEVQKQKCKKKRTENVKTCNERCKTLEFRRTEIETYTICYSISILLKIQVVFESYVVTLTIAIWCIVCVNHTKVTDIVGSITQCERDNKVIEICDEEKEDEEKKVEDCGENGKCCEEQEKNEPSFFTLLSYSMSPLFMCLITLMMKVLLFPGLLPYSLLERDKCHLINMTITPVGLLGSTIIHILQETVDSIKRRWDWYWNLFWLLAIPPFIIFIIIFVVLNTESALTRSIMNNKNVVFTLSSVFFLFHSTIESAGYLGVTSNSKHYGKLGTNGRNVVTTNQMSGLIVSFIFYKIAIGYNVTRKAFIALPIDQKPTMGLSTAGKLMYWLRGTFSEGANDFLNDFKMNIRKYI